MTRDALAAGFTGPDTIAKLQRSYADVAGDKAALRDILAAHQSPILKRGLWQIASTFLPFFALLVAMYALRSVSTWLTLALSLPAAGLVVRIFIIQHDCGHGSFFRSRTANEWVGRFCGLITLTPYCNWRRHHANHHAMWNNLDRRNSGADIYSTCITVEEYRALSPLRRWGHRMLRHPLIAYGVLPPFVFVLLNRVPFDTPLTWRREWASVLLTDLAIIAVVSGLALVLGVGPVAMVQLPIISIAAMCGVWIFSVQHCFEQSLWARERDWNVAGASLLGTSYLKLPRVLQWFSGNIGFHHMHHLMPRMPNYRLEECHRACAAVADAVAPMTLWHAVRGSGFALWSEHEERMVRFSDVAAGEV